MHFPQIHGRGWKNNLSGMAPQSERFRQRLPYQGQRRRPPPVAETGRSCWGSGQQDASGARRMLGAATRPCRAKQTERLYGGEPFLCRKVRLLASPVSFWRKEWYNGFAALPAHFMGREVKSNGVYFHIYPVRRSECSVLLHLQVA